MAKTRKKTAVTIKPWAMTVKDLTVRKSDFEDLYQASLFLGRETRRQMGLIMRIPVFIQDPLVALENPGLGVDEIEVRLEAGLGDGPTSARIAVVDYDGDYQRLLEPVAYDEDSGLFCPPNGWSLPDIPNPPDLDDVKDLEKYKAKLEEFKKQSLPAIKEAIKNPYFHQINVWAIVQRVLEFYENSRALGRPVPWGFDGNRLLVVPHAGYGENAFYDQSTKSLQFYYYGDENNPCYTCLSHDIVAHETGHAILDGIRPLYNENPSLETAAFHEFIGDLTAILLALDNRDIRHLVNNLSDNQFLTNIAEEFGHEVEDRPYLRSASNKLTMESPEVIESLDCHLVSEVLTGAMFDILVGIAQKLSHEPVRDDGRYIPGRAIQPGENGESPADKRYTPRQALWKAAEKFRRVALQPLDLCPPCDIRFIDYAKAVIRNDILTNPVDPEGYRQVMLQVFHDRKLCRCHYKADKPLPADCEFREAIFQPKLENLAHHDMERVSRSITAAYYFLHDNRRILRIPANQDITITGLYDNAKLGEQAERLPRQVVIQYTWKEQLIFEGEKYGQLEGKKVDMYCGGTLVFDDRGNLLSWFRKPGTQLLTGQQEKNILLKIELAKLQQIQKLEKEGQKSSASQIERIKHEIDRHLDGQEQGKINRYRLVSLDLAQLADMEAGRKRKQATLDLYRTWLAGNRLSLLDESSRGMPREVLRPLTAVEKNGVLSFTSTPHLRKQNKDLEASKWKTNF